MMSNEDIEQMKGFGFGVIVGAMCVGMVWGLTHIWLLGVFA